MTKHQRNQAIHATIVLIITLVAFGYWYVQSHKDAYVDPISNAYRNSNVSGLPAIEVVDKSSGTPVGVKQLQAARGL